MKEIIEDIAPQLQVGMKVLYRGGRLEGEIGEIDIKNGQFFIWHDNKDFRGANGSLNQSTRGYRYSWCIGLDSSNNIEILNSPLPMAHPTLPTNK